MKKVISMFAIAAFLFTANSFAQEKKDGKEKAKNEKSCSANEKKSCASSGKKSCCAAKKAEEKK